MIYTQAENACVFLRYVRNSYDMPETETEGFLPYVRKNEEMRWCEKEGATILEHVKNKRLLQMLKAGKERRTGGKQYEKKDD